MKNQTANTQRNVIMAIAFIVFTMTNSFSNPIEAIANNINSVNYNNHYSQLSTSMNRDTVTTKGICYYKVTQTNFRGGATVTIKGSNVELRSVKIYDTYGKEVTMFTKVVKNSVGLIVIDLSKLKTGMYTIKTNSTTNKLYKA